MKANTATEVKFTHNNYEYTESVTWVVTLRSNLYLLPTTKKSLLSSMVKLKLKLQRTKAYKVTGVTFESAKLSADKRSVSLLVAQESANLPEQKTLSLKLMALKL